MILGLASTQFSCQALFLHMDQWLARILWCGVRFHILIVLLPARLQLTLGVGGSMLATSSCQVRGAQLDAKALQTSLQGFGMTRHHRHDLPLPV